LSLILANPAPEKNALLTDKEAADHWGAVSPGQTGGYSGQAEGPISAMPKSRGTLVVCPVSLVGQVRLFPPIPDGSPFA